MKLMKQFLWLFFVALVMAATVAGCKGKQSDGVAKEGRAEADTSRSALRIGVTPTRDCLPAFIVMERGIAERHGLDLHLALYNARMDQDTAIVRGRIDGMLTDSVHVAYINSKHKDLLKVCGTTQAEWQLVAGRTSRVARLNQLGDKIIAHACFSATEWLTERALKGVKTQADVYKVQVNDVKVRYNMLLVAAVDAAWLPEPFASMAIKRGHHVIADSKNYSKNLGTVAFASKAMVQKQKHSQIELFTQCLNEANDSIKKYGFKHYADCMK